jgi:thiol:disulfide interchange protein DsbA
MNRSILNNNYFSTLCISLLFALVTPFTAMAQEQYTAGKHYAVLEQAVRTRDASKVEVVEVFWYGCSHCFSLEPLIKQWKKSLADDVDFWQSPAMWNAAMKTHARMFFTAQVLGVMDKLHDPMFTAMNVERKRLASKGEIEDLFADYGVDRKDFSKTFDSFSINSQVKQADARARSYKVTGTPEIVVNGKYRVSARLAGSQAEMLKVVDFLVAKERVNLVK